MEVKASNEKVFWNTITDNKPSTTYLNQFVSRMTKQDIKINFIDFYNIQIVSQSRTITYLLTTHNNYNQYWFFNGIAKILPNGYLLNFQLDIWATYTLPFFELLKQNNINIQLNRSHKFNKSALLIKDEMLDSVPIIFDSYTNEYIPTTSTIEQPAYRRFLLNGNNSYVEYQVSGSAEIGTSANYYYVFKDVNDEGYMWFIPALYDEDFGANVTSIHYQLNDSFNKTLNRTQIYNTVRKLEKLRRLSNDLDNKFLGCFILPNFFNFKNTKLKYDWITRSIDGTNNIFACLTLKVAGEVINDDISIDNTINALNFNQQVPSFNYADKLHQFALDKYDYNWCGTTLPTSLLFDNNKISINSWMINFTQSCFIKLLDLPNNRIGINEGILKLPADLPTWIDTYNNYVSANKHQRDNQLNIIEQTKNKGIVSNVFGGIFGGIEAIGNREFGSIATSLFSTGLGLANSILGYKNQLNTMKAQYADLKNTMGDEIQSGNIEDAVVGYYNYKFATPSHFVRHKNLTSSTIKALNNVLYLYGRYEPQIDTLNNFTIRTDFNYYLFDNNYLTTIFANHIQTNVPQELYPFIINQLSNGVRIWITQPNN